MSDIQQAGEALQAAGELAQKKILERWVSSTLEPRELACTDLFEDMKDGWLLFNLLEVLSDSDLKSIGKWSKGKMRIQIVANMNIVFKYLKSAIKLNNIGPTDVVDGNAKLVLALLWMIMGHFATAELEAGGVDIKTLKRRLQHWLLAYSVAPQNSSAFDPQGEAPFPVPNLNRALQDGQVLLAVLHHFNPGECPPAQERVTGTPVTDLEVALDEMATLHGVEKLLDPGAKLEDKYTLPYLVQMVGKLHEKFGSSADEGSCRPLSDPTLDEPPASDPSAQALKASQADLAAQAASKEAAEENLKGMTAKVKELELDKEKLESLVGQLEDELMKSKEELAGANTLARKASVAAMGSPPASPTGGGGSVPPVPSSPPPPPPPTTSAPAPVPTSAPPPPPSPSPEGENGTCSVCGGNLDSRLEMMEQQHKEALETALAGAEERFSEIETRHVARADDLEARLLAAERDRAAESSRHLKAIQELSSQLEAAKLEAETSSSERDELAASVKAEREVMAKRVQDQDAERRKLHNTIQDLRGNVRVFARVRPFLPHEQPKLRSGEEPWLRVDADGTTVHTLASSSADKDSAATGPYNPDEVEVTHSFSFDRTFGCEDGQETVFVEVSEFVQSALDGYNVCLFSYGQTGSGKTHTMTGFPDGPERGIIPRAIEQVAKRKGQLEEAGWSFEMEISFIEIYCEQIKDLLSTEDPSDAAGGSGGGSSNKTKYKIIQNEFGQNVVTNVEMVPVDPSDTGSIAELMQHAASLRSVTATKMNAESSRSHSVFTLHMTAEHAKQGITLHGQLNLVDLAGSERVEKSGVSGQALTEAKHINTSLSALAGVFLALGKKNSHVPFRDSKLTELLHPALSANGKTLMMLNLSPQETSISESISSLRFGTNVNSCELGKAKRVIKRKEKERGASPGASSRSRSTTSPPQVAHGGRERSRSPNRDRENSPVRRSSMGTKGVGGRGAASPAGRGGGRTPPPGRPQARRSITKEKESPAKN